MRLRVPPARWRAMRAADLRAVDALAAELHPAYPESFAVLAEKLATFPRGCFVLELGSACAGYCLSHPWRGPFPPALDTPLGTLPAKPDVYFLHDIALRADARGSGRVAHVLALAAEAARECGLERLVLVAVNGSEPVWTRHGFSRVGDPAVQRYVTRAYGAEAVAMHRGEKLSVGI